MTNMISRRLIAGLLETPQHLGLVLGVEALQIRLGVKQVTATDKDGNLAVLGLAGAAPRRGRRHGFWWGVWGLGRRGRARLTHRRRNWLRPGILHLGSHREDPAQVGGEVPCGGVAILLPLRQCLEARLSQLGRNVADKLSRRLRLVLTHLPQ